MMHCFGRAMPLEVIGGHLHGMKMVQVSIMRSDSYELRQNLKFGGNRSSRTREYAIHVAVNLQGGKPPEAQHFTLIIRLMFHDSFRGKYADCYDRSNHLQ